MLKRYFDLSDDLYVPGRWELGDPQDEGGREVWVDQFVLGVPVAVPTVLRIPICRPGTRLDFSFLVGGPVPVVGQKIADVLLALAPDDVQLIPAVVESQSEPFYVVNVLRLMSCIDEARTDEVAKWTVDDLVPEKVGQFRNVRGMRIDPARTADARIFRPWGWAVAIVVAEELKSAMERVGVTGARFIGA